MDSENPFEVWVPNTCASKSIINNNVHSSANAQSGWSRFESIFQNLGLILAYFCDNGSFSGRFSACNNVKVHMDYSGGIVRQYQFSL